MNLKIEIEHLKKQIEFFEKGIHSISPTETGHSELTSVIGPMLVVNHTSLKSILLLLENNHYRDVIILSRPFLEAVINIGFIMAKGDKAVIDSKKYAYQKGYRDLFRGIDINDFKIKSGFTEFVDEFEKAAPTQMKEALEDFSTKKGKEINSWTPETAKAKVEIIGEKYGTYVNGLLTFAFFTIYRDVSEIIHNSYYGVRIFIGMQQKDMSQFNNSEDAAQYFGEHQEKLTTLIVQQINISINALLNIISQEFKGDTLKIFEDSNQEMIDYTDTVKNKDANKT
jgi:hypothetical protein